jgi:hypothetical protein
MGEAPVAVAGASKEYIKSNQNIKCRRRRCFHHADSGSPMA